jgi:hypothetical protein
MTKCELRLSSSRVRGGGDGFGDLFGLLSRQGVH